MFLRVSAFVNVFLRQVEHAEDRFTKVATSSSLLAVQ